MEAPSLLVGIILMMVAAIGILLYAALVIAIPVCRLLDWLFDDPTKERVIRPSRISGLFRSVAKWLTSLAERTLMNRRHHDERS